MQRHHRALPTDRNGDRISVKRASCRRDAKAFRAEVDAVAAGGEEQGIALSYTWVKLALQGAGLVAKARRRGVHQLLVKMAHVEIEILSRYRASTRSASSSGTRRGLGRPQRQSHKPS